MSRLITAVVVVVAVIGFVSLFLSDGPLSAPAGGSLGSEGLREVYDPTDAGEELPDGYRQVLPRDAIRPVYEPRFVAADAIEWDDDDLVIGLEVDGEAKAYPVGFLNRREMVIDSIAGIPVLVTW